MAAKVGLDRAPVDLADEDAYAWLEACIWADQPERLRLFGVAAKAQRGDPPTLVAGDAVDDLAAAADRIPATLPLVVLTSNVLAYLGDRQAAFVAALAALAARRRVWWVSHEAYLGGLNLVLPGRDDLVPADGQRAFGTVGLVTWANGLPDAVALGRTELHGLRLEWLAG